MLKHLENWRFRGAHRWHGTCEMTGMMFLLSLAILFLGAADAAAATYGEIQQRFEAGRYQEVVDLAATVPPEDGARNSALYLAALSRSKLGQHEEARAIYTAMAEAPEEDAWRYIGRSGLAIVQLAAPVEGAGLPFSPVDMANEAVVRNGGLLEAHYQAGLAYGFANDYSNAAVAFERAAQINPAFAYAHYYAGFSYYHVKRIDLMATQYEMFLKLAPEAPERGAIESIMRTIRGR